MIDHIPLWICQYRGSGDFTSLDYVGCHACRSFPDHPATNVAALFCLLQSSLRKSGMSSRNLNPPHVSSNIILFCRPLDSVLHRHIFRLGQYSVFRSVKGNQASPPVTVEVICCWRRGTRLQLPQQLVPVGNFPSHTFWEQRVWVVVICSFVVLFCLVPCQHLHL